MAKKGSFRYRHMKKTTGTACLLLMFSFDYMHMPTTLNILL